MTEDLDFIAFDAEGASPHSGSHTDRNGVLMTSLSAPWLQYGDSTGCFNPFNRLHNEILSFCDYLLPTREELAVRKDVILEFKDIIKQVFPSATMHIFGSQMAQILTPSSDIDIAILDVPGSDVNALYSLEVELKKRNVASYLEVISNAKVPIVKLDHLRSGISIDICVNNSSGLDTGKLIRKFVRGINIFHDSREIFNCYNYI
jgi:non-canonical poly(A) RNA polymerase PAPD5/7